MKTNFTDFHRGQKINFWGGRIFFVFFFTRTDPKRACEVWATKIWKGVKKPMEVKQLVVEGTSKSGLNDYLGLVLVAGHRKWSWREAGEGSPIIRQLAFFSPHHWPRRPLLPASCNCSPITPQCGPYTIIPPVKKCQWHISGHIFH